MNFSSQDDSNLEYVRVHLRRTWTQYLNLTLETVKLLDLPIRECLNSTLSLLNENPLLLTKSEEFSLFLMQAVISFLSLGLSMEASNLVQETLCLCLRLLAKENADVTADSVLFDISNLIHDIGLSIHDHTLNTPWSVQLYLHKKGRVLHSSTPIVFNEMTLAHQFLNRLQKVLMNCKETLEIYYPWFWDSYSSSFEYSDNSSSILFSKLANPNSNTSTYSLSITSLEEKLLAQVDITEESKELLETYILKCNEEEISFSDHCFTISLKFSEFFPQHACHLLLISFQRLPLLSSTPKNIFIPHPSGQQSCACLLQITSFISDELIMQFSFTFLPWLVLALISSKRLINIIPSLMYLVQNFECHVFLEVFIFLGPYANEDVASWLLIISIEILRCLDLSSFQPIMPWFSSKKVEFSLPLLNPTEECYSMATSCIHSLLKSNLSVPEEVITLLKSICSPPEVYTNRISELCTVFTLNSISEFRSILLGIGHLKMKKLLHSYWNVLVTQIMKWSDITLQQEAFYFLASLIDYTLDALLLALKNLLIPLAVQSPSVAPLLSSLFNKSFETIAITHSETWITWILHNYPSPEWSSKLSEVANLLFSQPHRGTLDICEVGGYQLLVQVCLHRDLKALEWVASVQKKSLISVKLEAALPLLMLLNDSIQRIPWSPGNPDPENALITLAWLIFELGTDVAMIASQVLALLSSVAGEYPACVCDCWKKFVQSVDKDTLIHFFPSILMACINKVTQKEELDRFLKFLFQHCPQGLLSALPDIPPSFSKYQTLIAASKKSLSLETRIVQICVRVLSTDVDVSSASMDELNLLLMGLEKIPETNRILESLLLAIKRHPSLKLKCADCFCTIGAVDLLSRPLDLNPLVPLCDSHSLPQKIVEECLLPSFRTSINIVSQIFFAFTIQKICKFSPSMIHELNELDSATVQPLLKSTYRLDLKEQRRLAFPIFLHSMSASDWVCSLILLLSDICLQDPLKFILKASKPLLTKPEEATSLSIYLLPHIILNICLYQKDQMQLVADEFNHVLKQTEEDRSTYPCAHIIFASLSLLKTWVYQHKGSRRQSEPVQAFIKCIQLKYLADAAEKIGLYDTSLFYLENISSVPSKLFEIYVKKGEMDYALGVSTLIELKSSEHVALQHAISNDWNLVQAVYSSSLALDPNSLSKQLGYLNSMKELGFFSTLLPYCNGILSEFPEWQKNLASFHVEACWVLGQWEKLEEYTKKTDTVELGHLFLALHKENATAFTSCAEKLKLELLDRFQMNLSSSNMVEFHVVSDLLTHNKYTNEDWIVSGYPFWQSRLKRVRNTHSSKGRILRVCRSMNLLNPQPSPQLSSLLGSLSLQSAKLSMKDNRKSTAYSHLLDVQQRYQVLPFYFHVLMGKWLAQYENVQAALSYVKQLTTIKASLPNHILNIVKVCYEPNLKPGTDEYEIAHLQLLSARWMDITCDTNSDTILKTFHSACANQPSWDKPVYYMGRYTHKLLNEGKLQASENSTSNHSRLAEQTLKLYGRCLLLSTRYTFEAMPLLLNLWIDSAPINTISSSNIHTFAVMQKYVLQLIQELPVYSLLIALPQVTSRLLHKNKDVFSTLTRFIIKCLNASPSQSMWQFISSINSADPIRSKRARDIVQVAKSTFHELETYLNPIQTLSEIFIQISNLTVPKEQSSFSLNTKCSQLSKLKNLDCVVLPMQAFLQSALPESDIHLKEHLSYNNQVYFHSFSDQVEIMNSLVRPKKMEVTGSDGKLYTFLCKPKDDLRKDARLLEFSGFINRLLAKKRISRERNLRIRTYSVTPLSEECGLIEWIPRTCAMRALLRPMYVSRSMDMFTREFQLMFRDAPEKLLGNFHILLKKCPPLLHMWFAESFPGPRSWFQARLNFTRTCAVMSMVGYILGLGDRHCENILLDIDSGDFIHVDFNCLFEKDGSISIHLLLHHP
ncbi:hypothetical protein HMI54_011357 [Coelomomyces lativittatus]|nr:hypothetical protein HMI54_011357 [Coelomomyces lativittatus]